VRLLQVLLLPVLPSVRITFGIAIMDVPVLEPMNLQAGPSEIEVWVERFELWCALRSDVEETNKSAYFLTTGGRELYALMKNLSFPKAPSACKFEELKSLLLKHVLPVNFQAAERAKFNSMIRSSNTSFREFILQLQSQAMKCNFGDHLEEHLCDRLIAGVNNTEIQRRMLVRKDLTFAEAKEICEQHDDVQAATVERGAVLLHKPVFRPKTHGPLRRPEFQKPARSSQSNDKKINRCMSCGEFHLRSTCRFRNAVCHGCGKTGHIKKVCRGRNCNLLQEVANDDSSSEPILTLHLSGDKQKFITNTLVFKSGTQADFIVDTGSNESIIPLQLLNRVAPGTTVTTTNIKLHGVTGHQLDLVGECFLEVRQDSEFVRLKFLISKTSPAILGLQSLKTLKTRLTLSVTPGLQTPKEMRDEIRNLIIHCSKAKGGMRISPAHLEVTGDPVFFKRRILPYGQREPVKAVLDKMQQDGILTPVSSSLWATPLVLSLIHI
jgi:hypothetical protein